MVLFYSCAFSQVTPEQRKHSTGCFTQGLIIKDNIAWESCGLYGKSQLKKWNLQTGKVINRTRFDNKYFAEGLTLFNNHLFMLTWKSGIAFEIDPITLKTIKKHSYEGQGWGLTTDGKQLIMSNGSNVLQFINPQTFKVEKSIKVNFDKSPVNHLNELEFIDGEVWANVYQTDVIVIINPETGNVIKKHHLPNLLSNNIRKPGVLNGIAHDVIHNKTWVTGKNWPFIFSFKSNTQ